jgi:drug/metabolite transporter (DMT)-like permease
VPVLRVVRRGVLRLLAIQRSMRNAANGFSAVARNDCKRRRATACATQVLYNRGSFPGNRTEMFRHTRSVFMLLLTMLIWGSTFVVTKGVIDQLPPFTLAFIRVAIGTLVLLPFAVARWRGAGGARLSWRPIVAMGFLGVALYYALFNFSLRYTSASQGALVQSCIPAMTALVAVLWLRERASGLRWFGIVLSIAGVMLVFSDVPDSGARAALLGNVLMFLTVVCWGVYTSLAKRSANGSDPVIVTAGIAAVGAIALLPMAITEVLSQGMPNVGGIGWLAVIYLGAGASGFAYMLYNAALQHMDASEVGAYTNLIPIVGVTLGIVVLDEPLSAREIAGGLVVLFGVWLTGRREAQKVAVSDAG